MGDEPDAKRARDTCALRLLHELKASVGNPDTYKAMETRFNELKYDHNYDQAAFVEYIQRCLLHGPDMIEV